MLRGVIALLVVAIAALVAPASAAPSFPPLTGRVVDDAHVLTPATVADLTGKLAALEQKTGDQLVVVTLPSLQGYAIEDYGYQLGRAWGIGQKGKDNGVLFIVVPSEHQVRIEVGYGLEPMLTDALSSVILQEKVLPKFRAGDIDGGVHDGADAVIDQLELDPASAAANIQAAQQPVYHHPNPIPIIIGLIIFFFVLRGLFGRRSGGWWMAPLLFSSAYRGGGFSGGGFSSGGGFGGGFSGGGGSFGGGGASGSW